jgi:hypothetical protein
MEIMPTFRGAARRLLGTKPKPFPGSALYWEERYGESGNSGAGSYGPLAEFKAEVINEAIVEYQLQSAVEWGCGDGAQLGLLKFDRYTGVDVSPAAVKLCRSAYADDPSKTFLRLEEAPPDLSADASLSLDVIYHLVEDDVFDSYMRRLFDGGDQLVIVYSSNYDDRDVPAHMRHRKFTDWVDQHVAGEWTLQQHVLNRYPWSPSDRAGTSFADFFMFTRR